MRRPNPGPEDSRYQEVTEEIHRLSRYESFAIGRLLCQVRDERILAIGAPLRIMWMASTESKNAALTSS